VQSINQGRFDASTERKTSISYQVALKEVIYSFLRGREGDGERGRKIYQAPLGRVRGVGCRGWGEKKLAPTTFLV
jgi:hypothetical protein